MYDSRPEIESVTRGLNNPRRTIFNPAFAVEKRQEAKMEKWICDVCGYVYDPSEGDPDNGIEPGTAFEDVPDDWLCPECGAPKDEFSKA